MTDLPRVLVTSSRDLHDHQPVWEQLDVEYAWRGPFTVAHGACKSGGDHHAHQWYLARRHLGVREDPLPADWRTHGNAAGPIRNEALVARGAVLCLAFLKPCTKVRCRKPRPHWSHGVSNCADLAERAGIPTRRFYFPGGPR